MWLEFKMRFVLMVFRVKNDHEWGGKHAGLAVPLKVNFLAVQQLEVSGQDTHLD
jgi:hypothetical protein